MYPVNHTQRDSVPQVDSKSEHQPDKITLNHIHNILLANSPQADILFMMLEISLPIVGVIAFLTLMLLIMRHVTNKLYPNNNENSEQGDIELASLHGSSTAKTDKTLAYAKKAFQSTLQRAENRFPDTKAGGVFAWRLAMEKSSQREQRSNARRQDANAHASTGGFFGLSMEQLHQASQPRESSSVYSRSMDGVTLYPKGNVESWEFK